LTNNHVVDNADEIKVAFSDGREYTAKVVGKDPKTDVAVLKIDAKDLPAIEFADSDNIEVGDLVLAVGNPFGVGQTVTMGMVSAVGAAIWDWTTKISSRPTPRLIQAIQAVRWSMRKAG